MKIERLRLLLASVAMLLAIIHPSPAMATMPGGLSEASVSNDWVVAAASFAVKAEEKALAAKEQKGVHLSLVEIMDARQQVVAGMNYYLHLKVKIGETEKTAEAVVWRKLSGEHELTSWTWEQSQRHRPGR